VQIGRVTEKVLHAFGIRTVEDLERELPRIWGVLKPSTREHLARRAIGVADTEHDENTNFRRKSISIERTFRDEGRSDVLDSMLESLTRALSLQMKGEKKSIDSSIGTAGSNVASAVGLAVAESCAQSKSSEDRNVMKKVSESSDE